MNTQVTSINCTNCFIRRTAKEIKKQLLKEPFNSRHNWFTQNILPSKVKIKEKVKDGRLIIKVTAKYPFTFANVFSNEQAKWSEQEVMEIEDEFAQNKGYETVEDINYDSAEYINYFVGWESQYKQKLEIKLFDNGKEVFIEATNYYGDGYEHDEVILRKRTPYEVISNNVSSLETLAKEIIRESEKGDIE